MPLVWTNSLMGCHAACQLTRSLPWPGFRVLTRCRLLCRLRKRFEEALLACLESRPLPFNVSLINDRWGLPAGPAWRATGTPIYALPPGFMPVLTAHRILRDRVRGRRRPAGASSATLHLRARPCRPARRPRPRRMRRLNPRWSVQADLREPAGLPAGLDAGLFGWDYQLGLATWLHQPG